MYSLCKVAMGECFCAQKFSLKPKTNFLSCYHMSYFCNYTFKNDTIWNRIILNRKLIHFNPIMNFCNTYK